ncbi:hypothetical protein [Methylobacter sp.]|uniref:hypothetical protein n=2 Tax=Methylobacter sp. TaxID=2051955 RepID=UPI002FDDF47A
MSQRSMKSLPLLLIGIHREELAFGLAVAEGLDPTQVAVLTIPEGISGQRPQADQQFRYETLHRALYLQLLPHVLDHYQLLIDLHTGFDPLGPSADLICADAALRARLEVAIRDNTGTAKRNIRVISLGTGATSIYARTVIPRQIWGNPAFNYVGMEIYLPEPVEGQEVAQKLARELVGITANCAAIDRHQYSRER